MTELLLLLAIALVIFGPKRLPALGRHLGGGIRALKRSVRRRDRTDDGATVTPAPPELSAGD